MFRSIALSLVLGAAAPAALAAPGDHIRYGDLEFVPSIDLGLEYRTNVYRSDQTPVPAADFRIAPGANAVAEGDDHEFQFGGLWELRKYFFVADDRLGGTEPSGQVAASLDRFNEFSLAAGANLFKRNVVGFRLTDQVAMKNWTADTELADTPYITQFRNSLLAGIRVNPGPALEFVPGFGWTYDAFLGPVIDDSVEGGTTFGQSRFLNRRNSYGPRLDAKYAFLPRTSLVGSLWWLHNEWQENAVAVADPRFGDGLQVPNSNHIKGLAGIDGRFTGKVFAQFQLGYGVGLYNDATVTDPASAVDATGLTGLLVRSQLKYQITPGSEDEPGSSIAAGYVKDFKDSFFTSFAGMNEVFAAYSGRFGDLNPMLRYAFRVENYRGNVERDDLVNTLNADVRYDARDWAALTAGVGWLQRASTDDQVEYDDVRVRMLATFAY